MKKMLILFLFLTSMTSCDLTNDKPYSLQSALNDQNYQVVLGMPEDGDYEEARTHLRQTLAEENIILTDYYTIFDENETELGYMYELSNLESAAQLFNQFSDESYNALGTWFVYRISYYVLKMNHAVDSDFPEVFKDQEFDHNYQYDYHYLGGLHPYLDELKYQWILFSYYLYGEMTYEETLTLFENEMYFYFEEIDGEYQQIYQQVSYKNIYIYVEYVQSVINLQGGFIFETSNEIDADVVFRYEVSVAASLNYSHYVYKYQNIVLTTIGPYDVSYLFGSKEFEDNSYNMR